MSQAPALAPAEGLAFYAECLELLEGSGLPYLLAGTHAVNAYTGMDRPVKDLDVFCRAGDYPRILGHLQRSGYEIEVEDERWLAKVRKGPFFMDVIFNSTSGVAPVTDGWFQQSADRTAVRPGGAGGAAHGAVWSKLFVQDRYRFDAPTSCTCT